jgi:hypothetical protein
MFNNMETVHLFNLLDVGPNQVSSGSYQHHQSNEWESVYLWNYWLYYFGESNI